jgi:hypothetical protein
MSESASAKRRRARAAAQGEDATNAVEETTTEEVVEEVAEETLEDPMAAMLAAAETQSEPTHVSSPVNEKHVAETLIAASPAMFQVAPEVTRGALHHAGVSPTDEITIRDAHTAIAAFLKLTV